MSRNGSARYYHKSRDEFFLDKATAAEDDDDQLIEITYEQWMKITGALVSSGLAPVATALTQVGNGIYAMHQKTQSMVHELNHQIGALAPQAASTFKYIGAVLASFVSIYVVPLFQSLGASIAGAWAALLVLAAPHWNAVMVYLFETESTPWNERLAPVMDACTRFAGACISGWRSFSQWCGDTWSDSLQPQLISFIEYLVEEMQKESEQSKRIKAYARELAEEFQKESEQSKMIKAYARESYASLQESLVNLWRSFRETGIQAKVATTAVGVWYVLFGFMNLLAPQISLASAGYTPTASNDPAMSAVRKTAVIDIIVGAICMGAAQRDTPVLYEILATINVVIGASDVLMVAFGVAPPLNLATAVAELLGAAWITWAVKRDQQLNRSVPATRAQRITQAGATRGRKKQKRTSNTSGARKKSSTRGRARSSKGSSASASARRRSRSGKSASKSASVARTKSTAKRSQSASAKHSKARSSHKSTKSHTKQTRSSAGGMRAEGHSL
jgi:hypothetical protein